MKEFNNLYVEQTPKTPQVDLNQFTGELILYGKSIPENAAKVYEPVMNWVSQYILNARPTTNFRINLEYFNTSSSIWLVKILKVLIQIKDPDYVLILHIYIPLEDFEDMEESGDLKDAFTPISDILYDAVVSIGIKVYGIDDQEKIVKDKLIFI
jgi:SiaC family regulatory phosphoprotein